PPADHYLVPALARVRSGALYRVAHHVSAHGGAVAEVERALPALGQAGARGGDDDGFVHGVTHAAAARGRATGSLKERPDPASSTSSGAGSQVSPRWPRA